MTTNIKVSAHCPEGKVVDIKIANGVVIKAHTTISDGETYDAFIYGTDELTVKEIDVDQTSRPSKP